VENEIEFGGPLYCV